MPNKKSLFYLIFVMLVIVFFELSFRGYYAIKHQNSGILLSPALLLDQYYPGFNEFYNSSIESNNESIDILILGGSVLDSSWSKVEHELRQRLSETYSCPATIHNLARPSHSSLDSKIKYEWLQQNNYDLIILYHAINELRFNNCDGEKFEKDYGHVEFYKNLYPASGTSLKYSILPFVFKTIITGLNNSDDLLPIIFLEDFEGFKYGGDIKTTASFEENMKQIIGSAEENKARVILPTFASYVPDNYSKEKFLAKELEYSEHITPIEIWGTPEHIIKGLSAHNAVLHKIDEEQRFKNLELVELNETLSQHVENFNDICHLTDQGSKAYVSLIWPLISSYIDEQKFCPKDDH